MNTQDSVARPTGGEGLVAATWGEELRATFALAWPLVIAQLAQNALQVTDVVMLGWLGPAYLAAGALATAFLIPFLLLGIGVASAVAPLVSQARGARDVKAVRRVVRQGFWASIAMAAILIPFLLQIEPIFKLFGQDPVATAMAGQYMQIAVWSVIPQLGITVLRSLLSAFDSTRIVLVITVAGVVVNAIVNYLLIFGNFGFPRLELRGAAVATLITNIVMFALMLAYVLRHHRFKRYHILVRFQKPDWPRFRQIFRIGIPIGLTILAEVGLFTGCAFLMGWLGTDAVAAHAIALQCASMAFMVPLGVGMASTVRVGIAYGRRDREAIGKAGWVAIIVGTGFMAFSALLFITTAPFLLQFFLDPSRPQNTNALRLAATFLVIAGIFQLVDGAQVVAAHALRGLNDTTIPMIIAIIGYWAVGMPVAYLLGFVADWRGVGIWTGLAVGLAFVAVILVARFALRDRLRLTAPAV